MDARSDRNTIPLAVDLDGTLIATDLLWEGLFILLKKNPLFIFLVPFWAVSGPARLKQAIAQRIDIDPASLPYREELLERIHTEHADGRKIVLATGTPRKFADAIASHLGVFDRVLATDGLDNLTSGKKRASLIAAYGDGGFDYAGNSRHDLQVFDAARNAIVVAPDRHAARWQAAHGAETMPAPKPTFRTLVKMLRVHQWLKNSLIAVPMVLSHEYFNTDMIWECLLAFIAFSAVASAIYILNDFFDLALDRKHVTKRNRPFASGALSIPFGLGAILVLLTIGIGTSLFLSPEFLAVLAGYMVITTAYSLSLKRMLLVDVLTLAGLYTIRVVAGAASTGVDVSFWLLAFSIFFFLSLALVKRFVELRTTAIPPGERIAGRGYRTEDQEIVAQAGMASAFSSALVLALYMDSVAVRELYPHPWLIWPLAPIVLYLTMRVWILARRDEMHDDPVVFIIRDWRSQIVVLIGAVLLVIGGLVGMAAERFQSFGLATPPAPRAIDVEDGIALLRGGQARPASLLGYGNGRSYGDSCQNEAGTVIDMRPLNTIRAFNAETGVLEADAGVLLSDIIAHAAPHGFFPAVVPGTQFVTLGGAIANDVHGKNHHRRGSFGCHVESFTLLRSDGRTWRCSATENPRLFAATIGGMGLTGLILSASIRLMRVHSLDIVERVTPFRDLGEFFGLAEAADQANEYSVAWIDQLASGPNSGRGLLFTGNHAEHGSHAASRAGGTLSVPFQPAFNVLNRPFLTAFNAIYRWKKGRSTGPRQVGYQGFFFPLDGVHDWNRLYGPKGLFQHQCVVPEDTARVVVPALLSAARRAGQGSFLTVLKRFGSIRSPALLSFPRPGYTLTLDFSNRGPATLTLLRELDRITVEAGGAVNPYKDARMSADMFASSFPEWRRLEALRDPAFMSSFWARTAKKLDTHCGSAEAAE